MKRRLLIRRVFWSSDRGLTLLTVLLVVDVFLLRPLTSIHSLVRLLADVVFIMILVSGVMSAARSSRLARLLGLAALVPVATMVLRLLSLRTAFGVLDAAAAVLFLSLLVLVVAIQVFREGPVTLHRVQGAVAIYLMLGLIWGYLYRIASFADPACFHVAGGAVGYRPADETLHYFSFATLTTVGYGDVTPAHPLSRSLAMLEALTGQLFPVILIARLVAMSIMSRE